MKQLTPEEINERIAREVMQYTIEKVLIRPEAPPAKYWTSKEGYHVGGVEQGLVDSWDPMEDITHTKLVIEELQTQGKAFTITISPSGYSINGAGFGSLGEAVCMFALGEI